MAGYETVQIGYETAMKRGMKHWDARLLILLVGSGGDSVAASTAPESASNTEQDLITND